MAVHAQSSCTLSTITDVEAVYTYYYLASSTITVNEAPKDNVHPPGASTITVVSDGNNYIWSLTEPSLNIVNNIIQNAIGQLYVIECVLFSDGTYDWGPLMTSSTYAAAKAAYNLSSSALSQAQAANQATALLGGHFIYNSTWSTTNTPHSANIVQTVTVNGVDKTEVPSEWQYNTHIGANGIKLRYNELDLSTWTTNGLTFYYPKQDASRTPPYVQGESALRINTDGLKIYNKYTGMGDSESETNLANRLALSLTTSGLQLYEAGNSIASFEAQFIRLGQSGDNRVQIQNDSNYSGVEIFRKVNDTDGAQSMAWFGTNKSTNETTARIGYQNGARFVTSSGSLDAYSNTNPNNAYFHVDANSLTYGDYTAATTAQVEATNLALAQKTGRYAECSTAAATQLKVATITPAVTGWTLSVGMTITVKFTYANTNTTPKLKINGYGESLIRSYKNTVLSVDEAKWAAGTIIDFKWDGNNWLLQDMGTEAAKTASNYMYFDETNGLSISNASPATATNKVQIKAIEIKIQQSATNYASITADGMSIYKGGIQVANFGSEVIIGSTSGTNKNIWITSGYVNFREGTTEVGYIGSSSARFGKANSSRFIISSNTLQAYSDETTKYFEVSASGITYGSKTVANTDDTAAAAQTASNYITTIDNNGIKIHAQNNTSLNYAKINASGLEVFKTDGASTPTAKSVAFFGENTRIGAYADNHAYITSNGFSIYTANDVKVRAIFSNDNSSNPYAQLGSSQDSNYLYLSSSGLSIYSKASSEQSHSSGFFAGLDGTTPFTRIGRTNDGHISVYPSGISVYKAGATANDDPVRVAYFGSEVRIGAQTARNIYITDTAVNFMNNGVDCGYITGDNARFGKADSSRFVIGASSLQAYNSSNVKYFEVSASGITYGTKTVANTDNVATAEANAKKEATKYIYYVNSTDGIVIADASPSSSTRFVRINSGGIRLQQSASNYAAMTSSGLTVYQGGAQVGYFGSASRIGASTDGNIYISSSGMNVYKKDSTDTNPVSIAFFGSSSNKGYARIGILTEGNHIEIDPDSGFRVYDASNNEYLRARDGLLRVGPIGANVQWTTIGESGIGIFTSDSSSNPTRKIYFGEYDAGSGVRRYGIALNDVSLNVQGGSIILQNDYSYRMRNSSGTDRTMVTLSSGNSYMFGYGSYSNSEGQSYFDGNIVYVRSKGNISFTAGSSGTIFGNKAYTNTSDIRLKEDIEYLKEDADEIILNLKPFKFRWKDKDNYDEKEHYGISAQDLEVELTNKEMSGIVSKINGYYGVAYSELIPMLIHLCQSQQKEIEELKQRVAQLEK